MNWTVKTANATSGQRAVGFRRLLQNTTETNKMIGGHMTGMLNRGGTDGAVNGPQCLATQSSPTRIARSETAAVSVAM